MATVGLRNTVLLLLVALIVVYRVVHVVWNRSVAQAVWLAVWLGRDDVRAVVGVGRIYGRLVLRAVHRARF
jgi:hypothetical protein